MTEHERAEIQAALDAAETALVAAKAAAMAADQTVTILKAVLDGTEPEPALPVVSIADAEAQPGEMLRFPVTLDKASDQVVTVPWQIGLSDRRRGGAFRSSGQSGMAQFPPGATSAIIEASTVGVEPGTVVPAEISNPVNATLGRATATGEILAPPGEGVGDKIAGLWSGEWKWFDGTLQEPQAVLAQAPPAGPWTMSLWVMRAEKTPDWCGIACQAPPGSPSAPAGWCLWWHTWGAEVCLRAGQPTQELEQGGMPMRAPVLLTMAWTGEVLRSWIGAELGDDLSLDAPPAAPLVLGESTWDAGKPGGRANPWRGWMINATLWSGSATDAEVAEWAAHPPAMPPDEPDDGGGGNGGDGGNGGNGGGNGGGGNGGGGGGGVGPPPPDLPATAHEIRVTPADAAAKIAAAGPNTRIVFTKGLGHYTGLSFRPKTKQQFVADGEVICTGVGNKRFAQGYGDAPEVHFYGLTITGYESGMGRNFVSRPTDKAEDAKAQIGVIEDAGPNWTIQWCRLLENYCTGIRMGNGTKVANCTISDNGHVGILVGREVAINRAFDTYIGDCAIQDNCRFNMNKTWDSGGVKYVGGATPGGLNPALKPARDNLLERCVISGNNGPGVWWDWDCLHNEIRHCSIYKNHASGIVYEASGDLYAHHNQIGDNCTGSLPPLISFRCCAMGVQNSKKCRIERNLFVITREQAMAMTQHNRAAGTPKGAVYIGWFTATENLWRENTYLMLHSGGFVEQFQDHMCSNPDRAFTGVSCPQMCGTSATGCNINSKPTGETLGGNFMGFIPQPTHEHYNVSTKNTYRRPAGTTGSMWRFDHQPSFAGEPQKYLPDWTKAPAWDAPPGLL